MTGPGLVAVPPATTGPAALRGEAARLVVRLGLGPVVSTQLRPGRRPAVVVRTHQGGWLVRVDSADRAAEVRSAELAAMLPEPIAPGLVADGQSGALVSEWLDGWETLHDRFDRAAPDEIAVAAAVGAALARLHGILAPEDLAAAPGLLVGFGEPELLAAADLPGDSLSFVAELQSTPGLIEAINELTAPASAPRVIHGDIKLDNVLAPCVGRPDVRLVDWELSGAGDPMRDLGFLAGDYLFRWLQTAEPRRGAGLAEWFAATTVPRQRVVSAVAASTAGYTGGGGELDTVGLARYAGLFLLGRAFAWIEVAAAYSARVHLLVQAGRRLVLQPESAGRALFG
ncbi:MAG TPA: aminoglycoside phosphotransferase family protein [Acidimicrobiales bacterium]|nr:aminoglycoside phosphotransferase family protein [Acidimicrobiales bacterium]